MPLQSAALPKVSVIIPTYNRAHVVGRAIQSVLDQTYRDLELIVVDDCSIDNTEEIVEGFDDKRIIYVRHKTNKGAGAARNTGIRAARGEYIAFQDSDDEWLPDKLEKQMKVFGMASPQVGIVYSDMLRIVRGKREYFSSPHTEPGDGVIYKEAFHRVYGIGTQTVVIRRQCLEEAGMFDPELPALEDFELFIRLSKSYYFYHVIEPLVNFFDTSESISHNWSAVVAAFELILKRYYEDIRKEKKSLARYYLNIIVYLRIYGPLKETLTYLVKLAKASPLSAEFRGAALIVFFGPAGQSRVVSRVNRFKKQIAFCGKGVWHKKDD